jgi:DNA polymerase-3 subunit epsilon
LSLPGSAEQPIPEESTAIHGIKDEDVANLPTFRQSLGSLLRLIGLPKYDIVGFNCRGFDIQIIQAELERAGHREEWPAPGTMVFDANAIFQRQHPRDLNAACKTYLGREASRAHDASADAADTLEVFLAQLKEHPELEAMDTKGLHDYCARGAVDWSAKLKLNDKGQLCYNFGNSKGKTVEEDPGFAFWIINRDFPDQTKRLLTAELDRIDIASIKKGGR